MPRLNNGQQVLAKIEKMYRFAAPLVSPVATTLSAAADAGDDEIALTSETGLADNDHLLIAGDEMEVATIADLAADPNPTLLVPLAFAAASGSAVVKAARTDLGYIEDGGVSVNGSTSKVAIGAANARGAIAYIDGDGAELDVSFGLRESSLDNVLLAFGIDDSTLRGAGTTADPYLAVIGRDSIGSMANYLLRGTFRQVNNKLVVVDFHNCFAEVQVAAALGAKGNPVSWTIRARPTSITIRES